MSRPLVCSPGVVKPCIPRCLKLHLLEQKKLKVFWAGEASAHLKGAQLVRKFGGSNKHLRVAFRGAASTLRRHRCGWSRFKEYCAFAGISPALADDHAFAEFASVFADGGDSADEPSDFAFAESGMSGLRSSLASLRWLANRLALVTWTSSLDSPVLKGYAYSAENRDPKREAPALPLLALVRFEQILRAEGALLGDRILCGAFLVMCWASLRFADVACVPLSSASCSHGILRGFASRTKTSARGMAFGCIARGFVAASPSLGWGEIFLSLCREVPGGGDSLIPCVSRDGQVVSPGPPSYVAMILHLRRFLADFGIPVPAQFSLHSCKTTLLSWGGFLCPDSHIMRKMQGHHKLDCADLYAKDDVTPALRLQLHVLQAVLSGWRPFLAQTRGAAAPLSEPPCEIQLAAFDVAEFSFLSPPPFDSAKAGGGNEGAIPDSTSFPCDVLDSDGDEGEISSPGPPRVVPDYPSPSPRHRCPVAVEAVTPRPRPPPPSTNLVRQRALDDRDARRHAFFAKVACSRSRPLPSGGTSLASLCFVAAGLFPQA